MKDRQGALDHRAPAFLLVEHHDIRPHFGQTLRLGLEFGPSDDRDGRIFLSHVTECRLNRRGGRKSEGDQLGAVHPAELPDLALRRIGKKCVTPVALQLPDGLRVQVDDQPRHALRGKRGDQRLPDRTVTADDGMVRQPDPAAVLGLPTATAAQQVGITFSSHCPRGWA